MNVFDATTGDLIGTSLRDAAKKLGISHTSVRGFCTEKDGAYYYHVSERKAVSRPKGSSKKVAWYDEDHGEWWKES